MERHKRLSGGTYEEKKKAVSIIFRHFLELPKNEDQFMIDFIKNADSKLKLDIAKEMCNDPHISLKLYVAFEEEIIKDTNAREYLRENSTMTKSFEGIMNSVKPIFDQMHSMAENLVISMEPFNNIIKDINNNITSMMNLFNDPEFEKFSTQIHWMDPLSLGVVFDCFSAYNEQGSDINAAWSKLFSYFHDNEFLKDVEEVIVQSDIVIPRKDIIRTGLKHHQNGDYVSSLSVLLPHAEGLIWELGVKKGLVEPCYNSKIKIKNGKRVLINKSGQARAQPEEWSLLDLVNAIWGTGQPTDEFRDRYGQDIYSKNFRHVMLHGRDISQYSEKNSVMVILCLMCIGVKASK